MRPSGRRRLGGLSSERREAPTPPPLYPPLPNNLLLRSVVVLFLGCSAAHGISALPRGRATATSNPPRAASAPHWNPPSSSSAPATLEATGGWFPRRSAIVPLSLLRTRGGGGVVEDALKEVEVVVEADGPRNDDNGCRNSSSHDRSDASTIPAGEDDRDDLVGGRGSAVVAAQVVSQEEVTTDPPPPAAVESTPEVMEETTAVPRDGRKNNAERDTMEEANPHFPSEVEDGPILSSSATTSAPSREDQEIDAYIDALVASVENEGPESHVGVETHLESLPSHPTEGSMDRVEGDSNVSDSPTSSTPEPMAAASPQSNDKGEVIAPDPTFKVEDYDEIGEEEEEVDVNTGDTDDDVDVDVDIDVAVAAPGEPQDSPDDSPNSPTDDATTPEASSSLSVHPPPSSLATPAKDPAPSSSSMPSPHPRRRTPPPNAVYRFLLRRRALGGHVAAMALAWIAEFAQLFFPVVARAIEKRLFKAASGRAFDDTGRPFRSHRPSSDGSATQPPTALLHLVGSRRTGTSRSQQRSLAKRSDAAALQILRSVSSQARYRYVSPSFLQRHRLGPYTTTASAAVQSSDGTDSTTTTTTPTRPSKGSTADHTVTDEPRVADQDEEDDVDWILRALTAGANPKTDPSDNKADWTEALRAASSSSSSNSGSSASERFSRPVTPPRTSDREGGVLGRIRAVASDGIGRSLLGAYPGDAPPLSAAANVHGLEELGRRYGYGDWSDDEHESDQREEDDDELMVAMELPRSRGNRNAKKGSQKTFKRTSQKSAKTTSHKTAKKRRSIKGTTAVEHQPDRPRVRRKRATARHDGNTVLGVGIEFDFTGSSSADRTRTHRRHRSPSRSPTPPKRSSSTSSSDTSSAATSVAGTTTPRSTSHQLGKRREAAAPVRPILQGTGDGAKRSTASSLPSRGQGVRPALDRVAELKRRHRNAVMDDQEN